MKALGAEVVLVDQMPNSVHGQVSGEDLALVEIEAQKIAKERNAFRADQFNLEACNHAHEKYTAEEMWEQLDGNIDVFVDFLEVVVLLQDVQKHLKNIILLSNVMLLNLKQQQLFR
uniref:Cysteine synthase A n=1 Tax=Clostridioides difficile TaxID=1496 RepID=A0A381IBE5_CLODI|nr:cysteine synthase A [Clostridioides difficile]